MKYMVAGLVTISMHTEVEADSKEEAIEEAKSRGLMSLCHQCSGGDPDEEWVTSGELDGEPQDIEAEEME